MEAGQSSVFQHVLTTFKAKVDPKLASEFEMTTLPDLKSSLSSIQRKHTSERRVRNMGRLSRFLDAMDQYGKVIEVFLNVTDVLAFVWGPMKFLLQTANTFSEAFSKLLETYQVIGESLPLLDKCQGFLENTPYVRQALESIFNDILEFHEYALGYFKKPMWQRVFQASWATYKTRFQPIVDNLYRHKDLLEGRVTFTQLETIISQGEKTLQEFQRQQNDEAMGKYRAIQAWLGNPDVQTDHESIARVRCDSPEAGSWLLHHPLFQPWQDGTSNTLLLWLNGIPGAGKSVLASLIIDKCRENTSNVTIWFYCRHGDKDRSTFIALARALISQLLKYDVDLVPYVHVKMSSRSEQILSSEPLAKELLETLLKNCQGLHIILDGLDECAQGEGKKIIGWFRSVMEPSTQSASASNNPRCVFISQRDATTTRHLRDLPKITITPAHNHQDITNFVSSWGRKIQEKFSISDDVTEGITETVVEGAAGMFLFAKLVMTTLFSQVSRERLFNELNVKGLPVGLDAAYSRVLDVISEQSSKTEAFQLLAWLVCAKRPLEWREIQAAVAIDIEGEAVDFYGRQWMVDAKDLCGSLVESRTDGSLELVHTTAELYLVESGVVEVGQEELKIASLCLAYLALPGFEAVLAESSIEDFLKLGYYAFVDYAARYWTCHLREGLARDAPEQCRDMLISHIERLIDSHYRPCDEDIQIPASTRSLLSRLQESDFTSHDEFESFLKAFVATESQIETYGEGAASNKALDIPDIIARIRTILEDTVCGESWDEDDRELFAFYYGEAIYKCPRISCSYFHRGFTSGKEREAHIRKHTLPYSCSYPGCLRVAVGFSSQSELQRHISQTHEMAQSKGQIFPSKQKRPVLQCGMCQRSFDKPGKLRNHGCRQDTPKSRLLDRSRVRRPETEPGRQQAYLEQLLLVERANKARLQIAHGGVQDELDQQLVLAAMQVPARESQHLSGVEPQKAFVHPREVIEDFEAEAHQLQPNAQTNKIDTSPPSPSNDTPLDMTNNSPQRPRPFGMNQYLPWLEPAKEWNMHMGPSDRNSGTQQQKDDFLLYPTNSISSGTSSATPQTNQERFKALKEIDHETGVHRESLQSSSDPTFMAGAPKLNRVISHIYQDKLFPLAIASSIPVSSGFPIANETAPDSVAPDKEEPYIIKCACAVGEDNGNMVFCEGCGTLQHIICYYPDKRLPDVHNCVSCEHRDHIWEEAINYQPQKDKVRYGDGNGFGHQRSENSTDSTSIIPINFVDDQLQAANQAYKAMSSTPPAMPANNEDLFPYNKSLSVDEGNQLVKNSLPLSQSSNPASLASQPALRLLHAPIGPDPPEPSSPPNNTHPQNHILDPQEAPLDYREWALSPDGNELETKLPLQHAIHRELLKQGLFTGWQAYYHVWDRVFNISKLTFSLQQIAPPASLRQAAEACIDFEARIFQDAITSEEYKHGCAVKLNYLHSVDTNRVAIDCQRLHLFLRDH